MYQINSIQNRIAKLEEKSFSHLGISECLLIQDLATMHAIDHAMRNAWLAGAPWDDTLDRRHTTRMKEIVAQIGLPRA